MKLWPPAGRGCRISPLTSDLVCLACLSHSLISFGSAFGTTLAKNCFCYVRCTFFFFVGSVCILSWWCFTALLWYAYKTVMGKASLGREPRPHHSKVNTSVSWYRSSQTQSPWNWALSLYFTVIWRKWTQSPNILSALLESASQCYDPKGLFNLNHSVILWFYDGV